MDYFEVGDAAVGKINPEQVEASGLPSGSKAAVLKNGDVLVFTGLHVVLRPVDRCQHCGIAGGH
jgi:hypothetical protein